MDTTRDLLESERLAVVICMADSSWLLLLC